MDVNRITSAGASGRGWTCQILPTGAGLKNMGNTCYLSSVLQCLTYTPPLASSMITGDHSRRCHESGFCMMCTMEKHIIQVFTNPGSIIEPTAVLSQLHWIGQQFELGVQQDAHEFFVHVLQAMHQSSPSGYEPNRQTTGTSLVHRVFEGRLRTTISCGCCRAVSYAFEPYRDIAVGIERAYNVPQALMWHLKSEQLGAENGYRCRKCKKIGQASRKSTFHCLSKVLVINLKRFDSSKGKIVKHVRYPEKLNLRPFMSQSCGQPEIYELYGVLVHSGNRCDSGHYHCHVKASDGQWYKMDDTSVSVSDRVSALKQQAYMLFYIRSSDSAHTPGQSSSSLMNEPQLTPNMLRDGHNPRREHRAPWNDTENMRAPGSSTDCHPTIKQSRYSPLKRSKESGDKYQNGQNQHPFRTDRKDPVQKPGTKDRRPATESVSLSGKRGRVEEDNEPHNEPSVKRQMKINRSCLKSDNPKDGTQNIKRRAGQNLHNVSSLKKVLRGHKRALTEQGVCHLKDNTSGSSSGISVDAFSLQRSNVSSSSTKFTQPDPVMKRRSHKRKRDMDDQESYPAPKRARVDSSEFNFKGGNKKSCPGGAIDDLCDCLSRLRLA